MKISVELPLEVFKLHLYKSQYSTRSLNVETALGIPGTARLDKCLDLAVKILDDNDLVIIDDDGVTRLK